MSDSRIVYITDLDVSRDNAAGINERGFVQAISDRDGVVCILPMPASPDRYFNPRIEYVFGHRGSAVLYPLHLMAAARRMMTLHRRYRFRAIVLRLGVMPIVPLIFSAVFGTPLFLKTHSGYKPMTQMPLRTLLFPNTRWKRRDLKVRIANALFGPIREAIIRRASLIDCPSATCRRLVAEKSNVRLERLLVVPNGVDTEIFRPSDQARSRAELGLNRFQRLVGYVGALNADKRWLDCLIKAMVILGQVEPTGCLLVGDGPERADLERLTCEEGLADRVVFVGQVPSKMVATYIGALDVAVDLCAVPMQVSGHVTYASYSQKMAQYLACGRPVVAWDIEDNQLVAEHDVGCLASLFDPVDLASKISAILSMPLAARDSLRQRARRVAEEELSYSALASRRLRVWRQASPGPPPMPAADES